MSTKMKECRKLLKWVCSQSEAEPFLKPVDWKAWGLHDYPLIVKQPMDLGKVEKKLDDGEYETPADFAKDVNLIWSNCMRYNQDDSDYYKWAMKLKKSFGERMAPLMETKDSVDDDRVPTQGEKKTFSQNIYVVTPEELGRVVTMLDDMCAAAIQKIGDDDIEIDIDKIDPATFWVLDKFVKECMVPMDKKKRADAGAGGGSGGSALQPAAKKQRH